MNYMPLHAPQDANGFSLRTRILTSREKLRCSRTGCIQASRSSSIFLVSIFPNTQMNTFIVTVTSGWNTTYLWRRAGAPPFLFWNSDFIIPRLILTPLSSSTSCRRPVPLQEGPLGIQHRGRRLRNQATLRLLQGEPIAQRVLPVRAGGSSSPGLELATLADPRSGDA